MNWRFCGLKNASKTLAAGPRRTTWYRSFRARPRRCCRVDGIDPALNVVKYKLVTSSASLSFLSTTAYRRQCRCRTMRPAVGPCCCSFGGISWPHEAPQSTAICRRVADELASSCRIVRHTHSALRLYVPTLRQLCDAFTGKPVAIQGCINATPSPRNSTFYPLHSVVCSSVCPCLALGQPWKASQS